jgi:hypothetical protein
MDKFTSLKIVFLTTIAITTLIGIYVLSVVWRVSAAQQECFGRSALIPLCLPVRAFHEPPVSASFGDRTFEYNHNGLTSVIWRQKLNGFQHIYGSALAAFELGDYFADKLFCANEFAEALCDWNTITLTDRLDRKKDLWNNRIGRAIGVRVSRMGMVGAAGERQILADCEYAIEHDPHFMGHYLDPRARGLSEKSLGCLFLPRYNAFNVLLHKF